MQRFWVRYLLFITVLTIFASSVFFARHNKQSIASVNISKIPLSFGDWRGEEGVVENDVKNILETDMVLMRRYENSKEDAVNLAIVYYRDSRVSLHLPESCLMGQGSRLTERKPEIIRTSDNIVFNAMRLITKSDRINYLVLYYFETGNFRTNSYFAFRKKMLLNKMKGLSFSGALVRFSIAVTESNLEEKAMSLKKFISEITPQLLQHLP